MLATSALFFLFQHPEVLQKLKAEISTHIESSGSITAADIKELKYAELVLKETNRLEGPICNILSRKATEDMLVGDIPIRKGTGLNYMFRANFFDPKYFEQPFEFRPERMDETRNKEAGMQQIIDSAFSVGPKTCIGKHLAHIETKIMLVKFLERYSGMKELQERVITLGTMAQYKHSDVEVTKATL